MQTRGPECESSVLSTKLDALGTVCNASAGYVGGRQVPDVQRLASLDGSIPPGSVRERPYLKREGGE